MYNTKKPNLDELPTTAQLIKSTKVSAIVAVAILFTIILPAEYGVDPFGIGGLFGLTEMGKIKKSLADEAKKADEAKTDTKTDTAPTMPQAKNDSFGQMNNDPAVQNTTNPTIETEIKIKSDSMSVVIPNDGYLELKAIMSKGDTIEYFWKTMGGVLNYNVHGESSSNGGSYEYDDGKNKSEMSGTITAKFDGTHGWFWRNRSGNDITVTLTVEGDFEALVRK